MRRPCDRRRRRRVAPRAGAGAPRRLVHITTTDMSLDWLLGPQLRAFADEGYEVIGVSAPGPHVPALTEAGIRHVPIPAFTRSRNPLGDLRALVQLVRALRELRPDIVHTHNPKPGILGRIAARLVGVPLIVNTQHGLYAQPSDPVRRRWPVYAVERIAAAFGDVELIQNPEDVDTLVSRLRVPHRRVRLLGNGVDLGRFDPDRLDPGVRERIRTEWGIGPDEIVVGTVGRLVREKGIVELLEAMHRISARGIDSGASIRLVIVGPEDPDKSDAIDAAQRARAIADGAVFTGERHDMPECYAAFDVFVTASWREGFPRAAMEAAAMGLPIVGTDIRGNRQVIAEGVTGVLVPVRDPEALAAAIREYATDAAGRLRAGEAARARAARDFDQRGVIARTLAAYRSP